MATVTGRLCLVPLLPKTSDSAAVWATDFDRANTPAVRTVYPAFVDAPKWGVSRKGEPMVVRHDLGGHWQRMWERDYLHRLHISIRAIDLGNIIDAQTYSVFIWNAHMREADSRTLLRIANITDGLRVDGPATPVSLRADEEMEWTLTILADGPATVDDTLVWEFEETPLSLYLTGRRVIAWPYAPDWSEPVIERLQWLTDIMRSETGIEQRRALRSAPRRALSAQFVEGAESRQMMELALYGWSGRVYCVPSWPDVQWLTSSVAAGATFIPCQTAGFHFRAGGMALLRDNATSRRNEVVSVVSVESGGLTIQVPLNTAWPARTRLYPALEARLEDLPSFRREGDRVEIGDATFVVVENSDWDGSYAASRTYQGWPVLEINPDEAQELSIARERLISKLDNETGKASYLDGAGVELSLLGWAWSAAGRDRHNQYKDLLYYLRGRCNALWVCTCMRDLTVTEHNSATRLLLPVVNVQFYRMWTQKTGRQDIRIETRDGQILYRRIVSAGALDADVEQLTIDEQLPEFATPDYIRKISFMTLCRLNNDEVEIRHITDNEGWAESNVTFAAVLDERTL